MELSKLNHDVLGLLAVGSAVVAVGKCRQGLCCAGSGGRSMRLTAGTAIS